MRRVVLTTDIQKLWLSEVTGHQVVRNLEVYTFVSCHRLDKTGVTTAWRFVPKWWITIVSTLVRSVLDIYNPIKIYQFRQSYSKHNPG